MSKRLEQRKRRTRAKLFGTADRPRASVWRGNRSVAVQLIDDEHHKTLLTVTNKHASDAGVSKTEQAERMGALVAQQAKEKGISAVVFDRGGYRYHGRVKAIAEAMREGGLVF